MATQTATSNERKSIVEWFENSFKEAAKQTTRTKRLENGRVSYGFSVVNDSGFDFSDFSFKIRILDKETRKEIGSATIDAGAWAAGEKKNFKSNISIPENVKSISFIMYSESLNYEGRPAQSSFKDIGEHFAGEDGRVIGELFGTGGMPETTKTVRTTTTTSNGRTVTRTSTTTTGSVKTYSQRKKEKKLNKIRMGKSAGFVWALVFGLLFLLTGFFSPSVNEMAQIIEYCSIGGGLTIFSIIYKLWINSRGKMVRFYEASVNKNGNTALIDLAAKRGKNVAKVADELQKMIAMGFFSDAYVDLENGLLVMTRNGEPIESVAESAAASRKARRKAARENGEIPDTIEDLLVMTDDKEIKTKLNSLKAIQDKVDARIAEVPKLKDQVKDYQEKYYPEVVRLTDEYNEKIANLDAADNDDNKSELEINASRTSLADQAKSIKEQLMKMIDLVIEASENLLDKLYEDDINDISMDIKSLQATLASKGLLDSDFDIKL